VDNLASATRPACLAHHGCHRQHLQQALLHRDAAETVNEILARVVPPRMVQRLAFLSGPSFAAEVAKAQPTLVTIGANDDAVGARVQALMSSPMFRCYRTTDVAGIELGGALKNVLAIACG